MQSKGQFAQCRCFISFPESTKLESTSQPLRFRLLCLKWFYAASTPKRETPACHAYGEKGDLALRYPARKGMAGFLCFLAAAWATALAAQEAGPPRSADKEKPAASEPVEPAAPPPPRGVEEAQPPLYYLKDNKGNLQAVPNFTLEDFEALYKLKHQLVQGDQRPRFSLQQMIANGAVNAAGQAELTIQFRILVRDDQWTRIPLRLDHAVLCETPQYQGPGEHLVSFEGDGEGYVAWIRGPAGQQHQLTLKMLVPTTAAGQETHLRLSAPRATVAELKLKVPFARAVARVSEGATLQSPRRKQPRDRARRGRAQRRL